MSHRWIDIEAFNYEAMHPSYLESHHICIIGRRSDFRVFYSYCPVPNLEKDRCHVYYELLKHFHRHLEDEGNHFKYDENEYRGVVKRFMEDRAKAIRIDMAPILEEARKCSKKLPASFTV